MTNLHEREYEDEHGKMVKSEDITCLGSYTHHGDGFFQWTCGKCGMQHDNRWWSISGKVWYCGRKRLLALSLVGKDDKIIYDEGCGAKNLLVRTNCAEITESLMKKWEETERWKENEKLRGIRTLNRDQVLKVYKEMMQVTNAALQAALNKAEMEVSKPDEIH
jgi:ribosomal protein S27AE